MQKQIVLTFLCKYNLEQVVELLAYCLLNTSIRTFTSVQIVSTLAPLLTNNKASLLIELTRLRDDVTPGSGLLDPHFVSVSHLLTCNKARVPGRTKALVRGRRESPGPSVLASRREKSWRAVEVAEPRGH